MVKPHPISLRLSCACVGDLEEGAERLVTEPIAVFLPLLVHQPGTLLGGRYLIRGEIAKGGYGTVYQADDLQLGGAMVAIKQQGAGGTAAQEAHLLQRLHHPAIPAWRDSWEERQASYLVMEFIQGKRLADVAPLPLADIFQIGAQLCDVLGYLHSLPASHGDLHDKNVLVGTSGGQITLVDFGLACQTPAEEAWMHGEQQEDLAMLRRRLAWSVFPGGAQRSPLASLRVPPRRCAPRNARVCAL